MIRVLKYLLSVFAFLFLAFPWILAESPEKLAADLKKSKGERAEIFEDALCSSLKKSVSDDRIKKMKSPVLKQMAMEMLRKTYRPEVRSRKYEAYYPYEDLARELKTSTWSRFENPTGIYFTRGENIVAFAGKAAKDYEIDLKLYCWDKEGCGSEKKWRLEPGVNVFQAPHNGLLYVNYYTKDYDKAPPLELNVATGTANGVYRVGDGKEAWVKLINNVKGDCFDIVGKNVQLLFCAKTMQKTCPTAGNSLIRIYDEIIRQQVEDFLGLTQFKRRRNNHMHGRTMWSGYMHADGIGAAFNDSTMEGVGDPHKAVKQSWGIAHEFGHVNQTRPNLKWVSTTEVTNNIFSAWANWRFNRDDMRLERESCRDYHGQIVGGRYSDFLQSAIVNGEVWLCQSGPDKHSDYEDGSGDPFVKLIPLWQLTLYTKVAELGPKDFWPQMFELARLADVPKTKEGKDDNGKIQLEFMLNACKVMNQNLMPFFEKVGMLKPIDKELEDYSKGHLTITEKDCELLKKAGKKYPEMPTTVLYYLCAYNADIFKNRAAMKVAKNRGVEYDPSKRELSFSSDKWKNVVAFEAFAGDRLVSASNFGLGSKDGSKTIVRYPEGSTRVDAIAWDGSRAVAYDKKIKAPKKK
ncbi:MAG: M60 family metallopeptidase [Opitutales bacterium]|nr:M60 family metallopeptidase [Opitutales bacterium]